MKIVKQPKKTDRENLDTLGIQEGWLEKKKIGDYEKERKILVNLWKKDYIFPKKEDSCGWQLIQSCKETNLMTQ